MNRRNFTQNLGFGALLGSLSTGVLAARSADALMPQDSSLLYSRERLEGLLGTDFACDNCPGQFRLTAIESGIDSQQFLLRFAAIGITRDLPETIYLLNGGRSARLALHMIPTRTASGIELIATINHAHA